MEHRGDLSKLLAHKFESVVERYYCQESKHLPGCWIVYDQIVNKRTGIEIEVKWTIYDNGTFYWRMGFSPPDGKWRCNEYMYKFCPNCDNIGFNVDCGKCKWCETCDSIPCRCECPDCKNVWDKCGCPDSGEETPKRLAADQKE